MIIGGSKKQVIENIRQNILDNEFNKKVELTDPNLTNEEISKYLNDFYKNKEKKSYKIKNKTALLTVKKMSKHIYPYTNIQGLDKLDKLDLSKGAIMTSNHFNPLDSYFARLIVEEKLQKKLYIVIQDTNLAMPGSLGYLMNYLDVLPISSSPNYIIKTFLPTLKTILDGGNIVLIYPEEEMWFNYRKPRPCKRGAYQFAHDFNVPVIPCFVTMESTDILDNAEFNLLNYQVNILDIILPDSNLSSKQDSIRMSNLDYMAKKNCYEKTYDELLTYNFNITDIGGWRHN